MAGLVFLSILFFGAFVFSFIGVVVLFGKTKTLENDVKDLHRRINELAKQKQTAPVAAESIKSATLISGQPKEDLSSAGTWPPLKSDEPLATPYKAPEPYVAPAPYKTPEDLEAPRPIPHGLSPEPAAKAQQSGLGDLIISFIKGGNLWAAGGVVLLMVGFGTLIAYLGRRGFFTVDMGIIAAALVGLGMILFGWRFRLKRPMYFLILQGGGIGILYLSIFAAHKLTGHFGIVLSLVLMSLLVPPAVILAMIQKSQGLAILGFLGGFAAPLLLSDGGGNHFFLFTYYTVLNCGVFAIGFLRSWKGLNLLAFFLTFIPSLYWALFSYTAELFYSSEPFFLIYILIFTVLGLRGIQKQEYRFQHYSDIILILGTPAFAAALQWKVFSVFPHGLSIITAVFSAFYLGLTIAILKKSGKAMRGYAEGYLVLGTVLANLIIPLELSRGLSSAFWAVEGMIIFFFGLRAIRRNYPDEEGADEVRGDNRIIGAGIIVHLAGTIAFCLNVSNRYEVNKLLFFENPAFTGAIIIALSALVMAVMAEKLSSKNPANKQNPLALSCAIWGFAWWFGVWFDHFNRLIPSNDAFLVLVSASAFLSWVAVTFFGLKSFIPGMIPAPLIAFFTVVGIFGNRFIYQYSYNANDLFTYNFFDASRFKGWLAFIVLTLLTIVIKKNAKAAPADDAPKTQMEKQGGEPAWFRDLRVFILILVTLAVLSASGRFYARELELSVSWISLAGLLPLFAALIVFAFVQKKLQVGVLVFPILPFILSGILALWFIVTLFLPGDPSPLPFYVPVINPLDLLEGFCIACIFFWQIKSATGLVKQEERQTLSPKACIIIADVLIFFWVTSILARCIYYYAGLSWRYVTLSDEFQLCLFVFWALYGITHIIFGHRKKMRGPWIAGTVLIATDIAKLILFDMRELGAIPRILSFFAAGLVLLFIGWAAPLPPENSNKDEKQ